jgi:hypothetical protein
MPPLEIQTCDGYTLQLTTDQQLYIAGGYIIFEVNSLIYSDREPDWDGYLVCPDMGVDFKVTIPAPTSETEFLEKRIPGQFSASDRWIYFLSEDHTCYEGDTDFTVQEIKNAHATNVLPDGRTFEVLTWVV